MSSGFGGSENVQAAQNFISKHSARFLVQLMRLFQKVNISIYRTHQVIVAQK
jgi:hypothetical protein